MACDVADDFSVEYAGYVGGTHFSGAFAQMLKAVEREGAAHYRRSGLLQARGKKLRIEIEISLDIHYQHFFPGYRLIGVDSGITFHREPCRLKHSYRSEAVMVALFVAVQRDARFGKQRLYLRQIAHDVVNTDFAVRMGRGELFDIVERIVDHIGPVVAPIQPERARIEMQGALSG